METNENQIKFELFRYNITEYIIDNITKAIPKYFNVCCKGEIHKFYLELPLCALDTITYSRRDESSYDEIKELNDFILFLHDRRKNRIERFGVFIGNKGVYVWDNTPKNGFDHSVELQRAKTLSRSEQFVLQYYPPISIIYKNKAYTFGLESLQNEKITYEKLSRKKVSAAEQKNENVEKQCALQKEKIISLQLQVAKQKHELDSLKKERDYVMSVSLLEEEIKCSLCYNKFSTDLNSTLPEIRRFLPVLSRAACPHYFCQGCVEKSQLAAAENAPRNRVPKWLKCMICKQKTAFCPEDPFYHMKLIELLERARRCHPIDVKVEEGHDAAETHSNSNDDRTSKRAKAAHVAIKEES